jgi:hypothetical protein
MSRFNLGASPQAPGIYRIVNQGRDVRDKTEAASYSLRLFPGYLQALGSLPSVALSSCKTVNNYTNFSEVIFIRAWVIVRF